MTEYCVSCGTEIPEGSHICKNCYDINRSMTDSWFCRPANKRKPEEEPPSGLSFIKRTLGADAAKNYCLANAISHISKQDDDNVKIAKKYIDAYLEMAP